MNEHEKQFIDLIENALDYSENSIGTEPVRLNDISISGYDFHNISTPQQKDRWQLNTAHFINVSIEECTFSGIRFQDSVFTNTTFNKVQFIDCFFHKCNFTGAKFEKVSFERTTRCVDSNLEKTIISESRLNFNGENAIFSESIIENTTLSIKY
jgi:uncharacterized protein YjbI with pentapeptide repeats